jgi:predicted ATPase
LLTEEEVAEYLAERFVLVPDQQPTFQRIARLIHRRTDGNPLFMVNVVEYLIAQGVLVTETVGRWTVQRGLEEVEVGVPESLRQMIEKQLERLTPQEQRLLEAASVAGVEFSAATLAAALAVEVEEVEEKCHALVRRDHFLRSSGVLEWPDGTVGTRYSFLHALYQEVLYERVTAAKRVRLHQCTLNEDGIIAVPYNIWSKQP